jgi:hypothetical protein
MSRGTIGITLALLITEYHRKIGTPVEGGDLGFRCPACSQPVRASEPASTGERGQFKHFSDAPTCSRAQGDQLAYAHRSDVLARYLTPEVRKTIATESQSAGEGDFTPPDGSIDIRGSRLNA